MKHIRAREEKMTEAYQLTTKTLKELSSVEEENASVEEETNKMAPHTLLIIFIILITGVILLYLMKIRKSN